MAELPGETGTGRRVAVVTGGAGAIGGAILAALSAAGHTVVSLDKAAEPPVDLARADQVRDAAADVLRGHGRCDVLVHAAAAFDRADLAALDLASWRRVQAVNVEAALLLAQAFCRSPRSSRSGRGRRCHARCYPATSRPRWPSSPRTPRPRSPARPCASTAGSCCDDNGNTARGDRHRRQRRQRRPVRRARGVLTRGPVPPGLSRAARRRR